MAGYNVVGCLTDVANLLFAMKGEPPATKLQEMQVVETLREVVGVLKAKRWWAPSM